jgi:D-alanine transaminase
MKRVYLNGEWLPPEEAKISVFDRGFIFGDGVYEVIPAYGGRLFRLPQHLQRLDTSLADIGLPNPLAAGEWRAVLERLVHESGSDDHSVYLQVTRGPAPRDHAFPKQVTPTVFAFAQPIRYPDPALLRTGITAVTTADIRWQRCDIKTTALLANVLLRQLAVEQDAAETILLRDGYLTEGAVSNIFVVRAGVVLTPPKGRFILPGITRDLVLELARTHGIPCEEAPISEAQLRSADEVWVSSSTREVLPVTRLDDKPVGDGRPGPLVERMRELYRDYKRAFRAGDVE